MVMLIVMVHIVVVFMVMVMLMLMVTIVSHNFERFFFRVKRLLRPNLALSKDI